MNSESIYNFTRTPLTGNGTWTGTWENVAGYASLLIACKSDTSGTIYVDFSIDGINTDSTLSYDVSANVNEVHRLSVTRSYARVRFLNLSSSSQNTLRIQTLYGLQPHLTSPLNGAVQSDADSLITRSVLMGQSDSGDWKFVPTTNEGHLEVAIHDPLLPFGSIHVENLAPVFQTDAVYGVNSGQMLARNSGSGNATASNSSFVVNTGTTIYSQGVLTSRKRLRYRAGQGVVGRATGQFTTPIANSYQLVGFGHAEDGIYIGYGNTSDLTDTRFGILYVSRGVRETRTLTISTGATSSGNVTITLNGTAYTIAVTNSSNIQRTTWEISQGTYAGWDAYPSGATVVFVRNSAGVANGTYSFSAGTTGSAASFAQTKAGAASTDVFIPQDEWNGDKLDGTGASGVTLDKTKLNIFQFNIGYLGTNEIIIKVKVTPESSNNAIWVIAHTIKLPNTITETSFGNPSFPFTMAAYSAGSTTDLTVKCGSFAGFIEGNKMLHGNRFTYFRSLTTVGDTNLHALFTILNTRYYGGRTNQAVINLLNASGALKHTSPCIFYLIRNGTLVGNPNFQSLATNSCSLWDTASTTVTYSTGDQLMATFHLGDTGEFDHHFGNGSYNSEEVTLQPGEWITLAARAVTGSPSYVTGSINTREDQ